MSKGYPSLTALLGLLAVAGYQNRDTIAEWLGGRGPAAPAGAAPGNAGGGLGGLLAGLGGGNAGGFLHDAVNELSSRFSQSGHGDVAGSWIGTGRNQDISPEKLESAIGPDVLQALSNKTGLSREDLLARLSRELPSAVDRYTPDGQLPH